MYYQTRYDSPLGELTLVSDGNALTGAWFLGQKYYYGALSEPPVEEDSVPVLHQTKDWLDRYFAGERTDGTELPLAPVGTEFQHEVWNILRTIPYGQVVTYGEIAKRIAAQRGVARMSAQAVGGAVGHNPLSIIVPCHRVVGTNGNLTGYAGGLDKKRWLLEWEREHLRERNQI
ncbi:MAG: methylated-DNA--[protein]-cysteine S-methyltransferase [Butyricicoccus sp.]